MNQIVAQITSRKHFVKAGYSAYDYRMPHEPVVLIFRLEISRRRTSEVLSHRGKSMFLKESLLAQGM